MTAIGQGQYSNVMATYPVAKRVEAVLSDHTTANPAPLGLMGFGMTTILLGLADAGYFAPGAAIFTMGLFFGGVAQIIAGLMEYKKGNTFGMTVFCSFGFFWIVVISTILFPRLGLADPETSQTLSWLYFLWGVFALYLTIGTWRTNRLMHITFASLTIVLFILAASEDLKNGDLRTLAGYLAILAGAGSIYMAASHVLLEALGRNVLPLFPVKSRD